MKVTISGSKYKTGTTEVFDDYELFKNIIKKFGVQITEICSGTDPGIEQLAERYAKENSIPFYPFRIRYRLFRRIDKNCIRKRNMEMIHFSEGLIAIWDGYYPVTKDLIVYSHQRRLKVFVHILPPAP